MADCAPVLIWMAGADARCDFFNRGWLEFTGRTLEQELGYGWAEGIHPEDFQRCVDGYLEAFHARRPFRLEYRLRRHDGEYRWILDQDAPRTTPGGAFAPVFDGLPPANGEPSFDLAVGRMCAQLKDLYVAAGVECAVEPAAIRQVTPPNT
ncbi:MAG: PAS domain-containing protein [Planctomycetes bacterium]|nr:PAS domain-containing protein [Planctomycetota bacterium]